MEPDPERGLTAADFDDAPFFHLWSGRFDAAFTAAQVEGIRARFAEHGVAADAAVLDCFGGHARVAIPLAMWGHPVTLVDASAGMIERARAAIAGIDAASSQALPIECVQADGRTFECGRRHGAALLVGHSLGYFETDAEHVALLTRIAAALAPGGLLVGDLVHRDFAATVDARQTWHRAADGRALLHDWTFDPVSGRSLETVTDPGADRVRTFSLRIFNLTELRDLLAEAGLALVATHADWAGAPFATDEPDLVFVARKAP